MNYFKVASTLVLIVVTIFSCSKYGTEPTSSSLQPIPTSLAKSSTQILSSNESVVLNPLNGHYYEAVTVSEGITWDDANVAAWIRKYHGLQGHLAAITSKEENDFIVDNFPQAFHPYRGGYWLGGFQQLPNTAPDQGWMWVTSEPFNFTNWGTGEPNNWGGEEDFLHYDWLSNSPKGCWNDISRSWLLTGYVVEFEKLTKTMITICHKPGTPAQKTMVIPIQALAGHLGHGDTIGPCQ